MSSHSRKPFLLTSLLRMKCPKCRKGNLFVHKSIFPLNKCLDMPEKCTVCGQKTEVESYKGQGMNYILTMCLFFLNILWYWPIFGFSPTDNSIFYFLGASIAVVIIAQPFLMRLSRVLYLYFLVKYTGVPAQGDTDQKT